MRYLSIEYMRKGDMYMRRYKQLLPVFLFLALFIIVPLPVQASTGYGPGAAPDVPPFVPSVPSLPRPPRPPGSNNQLTMMNTGNFVISEVEAIVRHAADAGEGFVRIHFTNLPPIHTGHLNSMFNHANREGVVPTLMLCQREGNAVRGRTFLDHIVGTNLRGGVMDFSFQIAGTEVTAMRNRIEPLITNNFVVFQHSHNGGFGRFLNGNPVQLRMAVNIPGLAAMNQNNLHFYAVNANANVFTRFETPHGMDDDGFFHFQIPVGGTVIITDGPLARVRHRRQAN